MPEADSPPLQTLSEMDAISLMNFILQHLPNTASGAWAAFALGVLAERARSRE